MHPSLRRGCRGRGRPPRLLELLYQEDGVVADVAPAGKGVCRQGRASPLSPSLASFDRRRDAPFVP